MDQAKSHTLFAKYALPQMIGLLFNSVYMIVDGVFIGNRLGRGAMAAAAVSVPLVEILIALSMATATGAGVMISAIVHYGFEEIGLAAYLVIGYLMLIILTLFLGMAQGLQPVFSYFMGTGEEEKGKSLLGFSVQAFLAIGILCYVLIVFFSRSFFTVFNPGDQALISFMESKSLPYFSGFFLAGVNILMIAYWQAMKHTKEALALSLARSVILPPLLIWVVPLLFGNESVWFCHSLSEALAAVFLLVHVRRKRAHATVI